MILPRGHVACSDRIARVKCAILDAAGIRGLVPHLGVLIGFQSEEGWFEYQLESNPEFLHRIAAARAEIRAGLGVRLEDLALSRSGRG